MLKDRVSAKQLENWWNNNAWKKYKAAHDLEDHTGGGDGDRDQQIPHAPRKARAGQVSERVLERFRRSKVYYLINSV